MVAKTDNEAAPNIDPRVVRTRSALINAFNRLLFKDGHDRLSPANIAKAANVGRSTFYQHFGGKGAILAHSISPVLHRLAELSLQSTTSAELVSLTEHFWHSRKLAKSILHGRSGSAVDRVLADCVEQELKRFFVQRKIIPLLPLNLIAAHIAAGQMAMLRLWLAGQTGGSTADVARALNASACASAISLGEVRPDN